MQPDLRRAALIMVFGAAACGDPPVKSVPPSNTNSSANSDAGTLRDDVGSVNRDVGFDRGFDPPPDVGFGSDTSADDVGAPDACSNPPCTQFDLSEVEVRKFCEDSQLCNREAFAEQWVDVDECVAAGTAELQMSIEAHFVDGGQACVEVFERLMRCAIVEAVCIDGVFEPPPEIADPCLDDYLEARQTACVGG